MISKFLTWAAWFVIVPLKAWKIRGEVGVKILPWWAIQGNGSVGSEVTADNWKLEAYGWREKFKMDIYTWDFRLLVIVDFIYLSKNNQESMQSNRNWECTVSHLSGIIKAESRVGHILLFCTLKPKSLMDLISVPSPLTIQN